MKKIKYFFEYIFIITFFFIFKIIGSKNSSNLGEIIGKVFGPLFRSNFNILKNLENSKIGLSDEKRKTIIHNMWGNYGRILAEYAFIKKYRQDIHSKNIDVIGKKFLDKIILDKKPVIFVSANISTVYVVAVQVSSKDSSTPDKVKPPLCPELSGAKKICVPLKPSEVTSTPERASNSCVVRFELPPTITRVNLSLDISKPSIVAVKAPS